MRIIVTGGDGFIGRNLRVRLHEAGHRDVVNVTRTTTASALGRALAGADVVFHLAGVNRPDDVSEYELGNGTLTASLCESLQLRGQQVPVVYASSTQAPLDNPYGRSKRSGEAAVRRFAEATGSPVFILRLTNVFGKWCRPHYNSVVATFCHCIAKGLPITINDREAPLELLYIDDAVDEMLRLLPPTPVPPGIVACGPVYRTTVGEVADLLASFAASRRDLTIPRVGTGLTRALYSTYVSYLAPEEFAYPLRRHEDPRGVFVEMLRTTDSGQVSYFSAPPGVTRGGHYHHSKTEKFLVINGTARFDFRHILTGQRFEVLVDGASPRVVDTAPGWAHSVTNVGASVLVVLLWANEVFDPARPDTIAATVSA